ncbi:hypothetical protein J6590_045097 [Homalodisca vitripennis]|nr:hypothetical protein J6590_045097 [Homalodisca vitripennis]
MNFCNSLFTYLIDHDLIEEANQPANLNSRIVFKAPKKREANQDEKPKKKKPKTQPTNSKLLSFDEEELDD